MLSSGAMSVALSEIVVPSLTAGLRTLELLLDKAEAYCKEREVKPSALLECRLAPDMFTFVEQVQASTSLARRGVARLADKEVDSKPDVEPTFDALRARVRETIAAVEAADRAAIDASTDRKFDVPFGPEMTMHYTGKTYALSFLMPNFDFHNTTAYGILRERGVTVGKIDYLGSYAAAYKVM